VVDGRLAGDNRTDLIRNAWSYLNPRSFWFSVDARCAIGMVNCDDMGYAHYGENPLSPLVGWGLLVAWPYYANLAQLGLLSILRFTVLPLGLFFLLLQRPYTLSYGYALIILLTTRILAGAFPVRSAARATA
jgi:hypothetical protein